MYSFKEPLDSLANDLFNFFSTIFIRFDVSKGDLNSIVILLFDVKIMCLHIEIISEYVRFKFDVYSICGYKTLFDDIQNVTSDRTVLLPTPTLSGLGRMTNFHIRLYPIRQK